MKAVFAWISECSRRARAHLESFGASLWRVICWLDNLLEAGEQSPAKDMGTKSNQFAGANNPGAGSLEKSS